MHITNKHPYIVRLCRGLMAITYIGMLINTPAQAGDIDPFHVDDRQWMSLDFYKDSLKNSPAESDKKTASPTETAPQPEPPSLATVADPLKDKAVATMPSIASPSRPVDLPVMPGINKGFAVQINSTSDDAPLEKSVVKIDNGQPSFTLPDNHWQNPVEFKHQKINASDGDDEDHQAIDVRMTFLPNKKIAPAASPEAPHTHGRAPNATQTTPVTAEIKKSPAEAAACAAVDLYKKKQLEAIQGDRETLKALQAAISQLGLQKQLNFIPGVNSSVAGSDPAATTPDMDMPVTAKP